MTTPDDVKLPCAIYGCKQPSQMPASEYCRVHSAIGTKPAGGEFAPSDIDWCRILRAGCPGNECVIEREGAAARIEALAAENALLKETWTDNAGSTWNPPTAWAYAQVCVAHESLRTQVISANAKIERAEAERDDAVSALRTIAEELVNAGFIPGDRTVTLASVRGLISERNRLVSDRDAWKIMSGGKQKIIDALEAERDALRRDAERFDYLRRKLIYGTWRNSCCDES